VSKVIWQKATSPSCHPLKCSSSHGNMGLHQMYSSLNPQMSANQMASRSVQLFLHSSHMCPTQRQTRRPCYMWHL